MSSLSFYDHGTQSISPLRMLVLGPSETFKQQFVDLLMEKVHHVKPSRWLDYNGDTFNLCVDVPSNEVYQRWMREEHFTHVFYLPADESAEDFEPDYNVQFHPYRMIMVDTVEDLDSEVEMCIDLMNLQRK